MFALKKWRGVNLRVKAAVSASVEKGSGTDWRIVIHVGSDSSTIGQAQQTNIIKKAH